MQSLAVVVNNENENVSIIETIDAIKKASLCDIIDLGIPENVALNLIEHLNNKDNIEK